MKTIELDIEKAAGAIIDKDGINTLTIDALALQMGIAKSELASYFKDESDLLKFLGLRLESEIQKLINGIEAENHAPEKELSDLFKGLYNFFNRKSYFLELLFDDEIHKQDNTVQSILFEIRKTVEKQLRKIIEQGKKTGAFNSLVDTKHEVKSILNSFRFFMSDIPMTHKMIRDLKKIREKGELF